MKKYEKLKEQYPEYISLDQLYQICRIAKRTARYLVENEIIPVTDTGRKTWRYKIAIDDVITYLRRREQWGSMIPPGKVSARPANFQKPHVSFRALVTLGVEDEVCRYFKHICTKHNDVLTIPEVIEITGVSKKTILRLLKNGEIKFHASVPKYIIPKTYLLEFIVTPRFINMSTHSEAFRKVVEGFVAWKESQML